MAVDLSGVTQQRVCVHDMQIIGRKMYIEGMLVSAVLVLLPLLQPWTQGSGLNKQALLSAFYRLGCRLHPT